MRILVTGGSGFIGKHLVKRLLLEGHSVINLDINESLIIEGKAYKYEKGTILNLDLVNRLIKEVDCVFHLASIVGVKNVINNPIDTIKTTIIGTENIMSVAAKYNKKIIYISTSEVYGKNKNLPLNENDDSIFGCTKNSRWVYAQSKSISEMIGFQYHKKENLKLIIIRPFNVVGPGQLPSSGMVLAVFIDKALKQEDITIYGDGSQIRCFTHVYDVVDVFIKLLKYGNFNGEIYNVGSKNKKTIKDIAYLVKKITKSHSDIKYLTYEEAYDAGFEEVPARIPDITNIKQLLGNNILSKDINTIINDMLDDNKERFN